MTLAGKSYGELEVQSSEDGTRFSVEVTMSENLGKDDMDEIFAMVARRSHGTFRFRVINAPNYTASELFGEDGLFKPQYTVPIPATNHWGKHEYLFKEYGIWTPYAAEDMERLGVMQPYLCTVFERGDDDLFHYVPESGKYVDVFDKQAFESLTSDYDSTEDVGVYILEELNSGLCVPITRSSHIVGNYQRCEYEVVNSLTVESQYYVDAEEWYQSLVDGSALYDMLQGRADCETASLRARYTNMCLSAEIVRDENLLLRALDGEDMQPELSDLVCQHEPLITLE